MKSLSQFFLIALVGTVLSTSHAFEQHSLPEAEGTVGGGGGSRIGNRFFDSYLAEHEFDPTQESEFKMYVEPLLNKLENTVPELAIEMKEVLKKQWYLVDKNLPVLTKKQTGIVFAADTAAFQPKAGFEVYIDSNWYNNPELKPGDKAFILSHELVQGVRLAHNKLKKEEEQIAPENVWRLNIVLLKNNFTAEELIKSLTNYSFLLGDEEYLNKEEFDFSKNKSLELFKKIAEVCNDQSLREGDFEKGKNGYGRMKKVIYEVKNSVYELGNSAITQSFQRQNALTLNDTKISIYDSGRKYNADHFNRVFSSDDKYKSAASYILIRTCKVLGIEIRP